MNEEKFSISYYRPDIACILKNFGLIKTIKYTLQVYFNKGEK